MNYIDRFESQFYWLKDHILFAVQVYVYLRYIYVVLKYAYQE